MPPKLRRNLTDDKCCFQGCNRPVELLWLGFALCEHHWTRDERWLYRAVGLEKKVVRGNVYPFYPDELRRILRPLKLPQLRQLKRAELKKIYRQLDIPYERGTKKRVMRSRILEKRREYV